MKTNCTRVYPNSQRGMEPLLCKAEGMNVAIHWMDKDSSSAKVIGQHYPDTKLMLCGRHAACAHQKVLKKIQAKKSFTDDKQSLRGEYPNVDTAKCYCPHHARVDVAAYWVSL